MEKNLRLEWIDPADLAANPGNWRKHPTAQLDALAGVMGEVGWAGCLLFNELTGRLVDGHARKELYAGKGLAPVLVGSWTEEQEAKILATLDPIAAMATADQRALDTLLRSVQTEDADVQKMLANLAAEHSITLGLDSVAGETEEEYGLDETDKVDAIFQAPFPWFGGKARVAGLVWKRFGVVENYIEPFFGSGAMLLGRPQPFAGLETVNDADGLVCNFWRAIKSAPAEVAEHADWPTVECDLHARHIWLVGRKDSLQEQLEGDPDYYDAKIAGWWVWGMACWIGGGFCSGKGPWNVEGGKLVKGSDGQGVSRRRAHIGRAKGVKRARVHLGSAGQGVKRRLVHLGSSMGVNRKLVHLADGENPGTGECGLLAWMEALAERFARVRVCCGDWTRVCGGGSGDALSIFFAGGNLCGIFLDPPYADTAGRESAIYRVDSQSVAHDVRDWAVAHGSDSRLRIALCGYDGEHEMPASWECVRWKATGGYASFGDGPGRENAARERIWFSPACLRKESRNTP